MGGTTPRSASDARDALTDALDLQRTEAAVLAKLFGHEAEPTRLGRFELLGVAGRGAMGQVFVARDPELERKVAIKVIRQFDANGEAAERQRERLVREAQAMAKIQHPNVISVHEVSRQDDDVFVVMDYVDGPSLRRWLDEAERPWREIVAVFVGAGRGLAAAHAGRLVHRDFKPDNVLVAPGGRAVVLDFGLARPPIGGSWAATTMASADTATASSAVAAGTPAYMAPEQIRGETIDAASDQFSFCVALFEALHGQRPFSAPTVHETLDRIAAGPPPMGKRLPEWLVAAVTRGLSESPSERWPSMQALVAELERRRLSRPVVVAGVVGVAAAAAVGAGAAQFFDQDPLPIRCDQGAARVREVWDSARRDAVVDTFANVGPAYATALAERLATRIDGYASRWVDGYDEACAATHIRGEQSEPLLDQRMACLDRELAELAAVVTLLSEADEQTIARAHALVGALPAVQDCADLDALRVAVPLPSDPQVRAEITLAESLLARAAATREAGHFADTEAVLDEVEAMEVARGYGPVEARYRYARGHLLEDTDDPAAERVLLDAVSSAEIHRQDSLAASCWSLLVGATLGDTDASTRAVGYLERFSAAVGRIGSPPRQVASVARARGHIARDAGRFDEAVDHIEEAIRVASADPDGTAFVTDLRVDLAATWFRLGRYADAAEAFERAAAEQADHYGPNHPFTARTLSNRGVALVAMGRNREAIVALTAARDAVRNGVGGDTMSVGLATNALASAYYQLGEFERAQQLYAETIRTYEAALAPGDARLGPPLANLARCQSHLDRHDDAIASARRAVDLVREARGADHIELATLYSGLGHALTRAGSLDEALEAHREALRIRSVQLGAEHAETAYSQQAMADTLRALGQLTESLALAQSARQTLESALGANHPQHASSLLTLGRTELALGRRDDATSSLERAVEIYETAEAPPADVAAAREALAVARVTPR